MACACLFRQSAWQRTAAVGAPTPPTPAPAWRCSPSGPACLVCHYVALNGLALQRRAVGTGRAWRCRSQANGFRARSAGPPCPPSPSTGPASLARCCVAHNGHALHRRAVGRSMSSPRSGPAAAPLPSSRGCSATWPFGPRSPRQSLALCAGGDLWWSRERMPVCPLSRLARSTPGTQPQ